MNGLRLRTCVIFVPSTIHLFCVVLLFGLGVAADVAAVLPADDDFTSWTREEILETLKSERRQRSAAIERANSADALLDELLSFVKEQSIDDSIKQRIFARAQAARTERNNATTPVVDNTEPAPPTPEEITACGCSHKEKVDCGFPGIEPAECKAKHCCWDHTQPSHWCFQPCRPGISRQAFVADHLTTNGWTISHVMGADFIALQQPQRNLHPDKIDFAALVDVPNGVVRVDYDISALFDFESADQYPHGTVALWVLNNIFRITSMTRVGTFSIPLVEIADAFPMLDPLAVRMHLSVEVQIPLPLHPVKSDTMHTSYAKELARSVGILVWIDRLDAHAGVEDDDNDDINDTNDHQWIAATDNTSESASEFCERYAGMVAKPRRARPDIYDVVLYLHEMDHLLVRYREYAAVVKTFLVVESTLANSLERKPLHFANASSRISQFSDKIRHLVVDPDDMAPVASSHQWRWEAGQRNAALNGLTDARPQDLIIFGDSDEIVSRDTLLRLKFCEDKVPSVKAPQWMLSRYFEYNLGNYWVDGDDTPVWHSKPTTAYMRMLLTDSADGQVLLGSFHHYRWAVGSSQTFRTTRAAMIPDGGWHFTNFGGVDAVLQKLQTYGDPTYHGNNPDVVDYYDVINRTYVEACITESRDVFGREGGGRRIVRTAVKETLRGSRILTNEFLPLIFTQGETPESILSWFPPWLVRNDTLGT